MALTRQCNLEIHQLDVQTTSLNEHIDEDIYMNILKGFPSNSVLVYILIKSLYGLKQPPRTWCMLLDNYFNSPRLYKTRNKCWYLYKKKRKSNDDGFTILTVYVDDCIVISNKVLLIQLI